MTPVDIGDTQGSLQARKICITPYECPETLIRVYTGNLKYMVRKPETYGQTMSGNLKYTVRQPEIYGQTMSGNLKYMVRQPEIYGQAT